MGAYVQIGGDPSEGNARAKQALENAFDERSFAAGLVVIDLAHSAEQAAYRIDRAILMPVVVWTGVIERPVPFPLQGDYARQVRQVLTAAGFEVAP